MTTLNTVSWLQMVWKIQSFPLRDLAEGFFHSILILTHDHAQPTYEMTPRFQPFIILY